MSVLNEDLLVSLVDEFLEPLGCGADFSSDFGYDPENDTIYFSIAISERANRLFKSYIEKIFHFKVPHIFMISLLHEVGHFYTYHDFSKMRIETAHSAKDLLEEALKMDNDDEIYSLYFDLSIEKVATAWAVDYYRKNMKRCEDFYSKFEKTLKAEYERIGLTE